LSSPALYGVTVRDALFVTPFTVALMLSVVADAGRLVWTVNPPFVAPAGITIDVVAGVATAVLVLERPTDVPPDGAAHSIVA
jgi:hypothetical protein